VPKTGTPDAVMAQTGTEKKKKKGCLLSYVKWVHCHHGMARPRVADRGDGLHIWRIAANIVNKQSRTADSG
jgi:hypothetical protein